VTDIPPPARSPRSARTYDQRTPRYAANAERSALFADQAAERWRNAAAHHDDATDNADKNGDHAAVAFYDDMADCARDAAEALEDLAKAARKLAAHYRQAP
jgi:hypothetical protein